jgi:large subunit ribosomal protein L31e
MSANKVAPMEEIEVEEEEVGVEAEPSKAEEPAAEKAKEKKGAEEPAEKKTHEKGEKREKKNKAPKKAKAEEKEEEKEEEEDKVVEEKIITINLRHAYLAYSRKQTPRSVKLVKKIAQKIFKTEEGVKIDESLNAILWSRGKTKSQRKVAIKLQKLESGIVWVLPAEA